MVKLKKDNINNKNLNITLVVTVIVSFIVIIFDIILQLSGQNKIVQKCSYLDPWFIDALSFFGAAFLISEGFYKIFKNKESSFKNQLTRIIRIILGFSILTLHIIQLLHK